MRTDQAPVDDPNEAALLADGDRPQPGLERVAPLTPGERSLGEDVVAPGRLLHEPMCLGESRCRGNQRSHRCGVVVDVVAGLCTKRIDDGRPAARAARRLLQLGPAGIAVASFCP